MLAVVPLTGLLLGGCGGSDDSGSSDEPSLGVPATSAPTTQSSQRYDITVVMVCDTVQKTLSDFTADASNKKLKTADREQKLTAALRKSLTTAFKSSTTPDATIKTVKVDRLLNQGCPAARARAIESSGIVDFTFPKPE